MLFKPGNNRNIPKRIMQQEEEPNPTRSPGVALQLLPAPVCAEAPLPAFVLVCVLVMYTCLSSSVRMNRMHGVG